MDSLQSVIRERPALTAWPDATELDWLEATIDARLRSSLRRARIRSWGRRGCVVAASWSCLAIVITRLP